MAYSAPSDLLVGDIPLPARHGNGTAMIAATADEMDSQFGHIYVTPVAIPDTPANRPARLLLKRINNLLASGRLVLDMAAGGEDRELHAYGASMVMEALGLLNKISSGEMALTGADRLEQTDGDSHWTGPTIANEDPVSLVETFYESHQGGIYGWLRPRVPQAPYGDGIRGG